MGLQILIKIWGENYEDRIRWKKNIYSRSLLHMLCEFIYCYGYCVKEKDTVFLPLYDIVKILTTVLNIPL
jgi:hypothetical protein